MDIEQLNKAMELLLYSIDGSIQEGKITTKPVEVIEEDEFTVRVEFDDGVERDIQFHNTLNLAFVTNLAKTEGLHG